MYKTYIAVIIGGSLGCLLRWFFSMRLNNLFPNITFGTLLVNLLAGVHYWCVAGIFHTATAA
jgi:CrcB protein